MQATPQHMDRRVLDPNQRAEVHHLNGGYAVKTGANGLILRDQADDAWRIALVHNAINGFEGIVDRRAS